MKRGISSSKNLAAMAPCLAAAGINFAFRYYAQSSWKRLTLPEARALSGAGIEIGIVYEDGPTAVGYFTPTRGQQDGQRAVNFATAMGQPSGTAIYFAVDYSNAPGDLAPITGYFEALKPIVESAGYVVGVYGGGDVCNTIKDSENLATLSWLAEATAWPGSHTYATWDIKQSVAHVPLCSLAGPHNGQSADYEDNQAPGNFGGFNVATSAAPPVAAMAFTTAIPGNPAAKTAKKKAAPTKATKKTVVAKKPAAGKKKTVVPKKKSAAAEKKTAKKTAVKTATKKKDLKKAAKKRPSVRTKAGKSKKAAKKPSLRTRR